MAAGGRPTRGSLAASFRFAGEGLAYLVRMQRSARIEVVIAAGAIALGAWLGLGNLEWAVLVLSIALVLILEGLNTTVELAIDLASPGRHASAKAAKDLAAGMVLLAALASIGVGVALFAPRLLRLAGI